MKCSYAHCQKTLDTPHVSLFVGDTKTGAFWGYYCSYDCITNEFIYAMTELKKGVPLENIDSANATHEAITSLMGVNPVVTDNVVTDNVVTDNVVESVPVNTFDDTTVWNEAILPAEDTLAPEEPSPDFETPSTFQDDGFAWQTDAPNILNAPSNPNFELEQKHLNAIDEVNGYLYDLSTRISSELSTGLQEHSYTCTTFLDGIEKSYELILNTLQVPTQNALIPIQIYGFWNTTTNKLGIKIGFVNEAQYNVDIDPSIIPVEDAITPIVNHIKGVVALHNGTSTATTASSEIF